ncbi:MULTISPECIES: ribulose-phosphate 3-epimerase [Anaerococcus]|jgi:ribulose-phosphate 3-epimerase|uniref:Ribulose-phosphate 3-epimerase n=1 Tax=Anaerococcus octavius TaxID=54007 RepID=A0A2I1M6T0_9FIRM|nr:MULTISPECIES: ribulose-phosphate 3-epimerase [Anaerococcus]MBS6106152.1 ribulose-phosphate 3-epimerase [Anaerococcus sp.]MDU0893990.1 ribulose-phosphate 3-epimerase [Anaerococcus sp.]MDU3177696.1 ribulose-phosphate 3-epimerase [Anaerococcus sp.]MDU4025721.1 ribulose-phosphate 3-epimerase [Anaerococcus sp.]MDU5535357.1 ribulose-phosphate 3-epimerase [Anaerococcus sp.]
MVELAPSILSCDFSNLQADLDQTKDTDLKMIHIDVMDGSFVPNISFGFKVISDIRDKNDYLFDTHAMIYEPIKYIEEFKKAGVDRLTIHYEACENLDQTIEKIKENDMQVGLTFKPATDLDLIIPYLDKIDLVLVMSVEPGFGGQTFMESSIEKIKILRDYIDNNNLDVLIQVDGGIKTTNVKKVIEAGTDIVVSGSDVFGKDIKNQIDKYYEIFNKKSL